MKVNFVTVVCVLNVCQFRNRTYSLEWVKRLMAMVERNLTIPFRFLPYWNIKAEGCWSYYHLDKNWPGWWAKMELFDPEKMPSGRILYLDLDCVITGSLDDIVRFDAPFGIMKKHRVTTPTPDFMKKHTKRGMKTNYKLVHKYNSGCMVWDSGCEEVRTLWNNFKPSMVDIYKGDQDYISEILPKAETMPDQWFRKLRDNPNEPGTEEDTRVVFCQPVKNDQLHEVDELKWADDLWRGGDA